MTTPRLMGAAVKRKEDPRLLTGRATYVEDLTLAGLHHVAFMRSPHAHARIRAIDTTRAARRPGVLRVVTGQEIRALCKPLPLGGSGPEGGGGEGGGGERAGGTARKHYPLAVERVRHVG